MTFTSVTAVMMVMAASSVQGASIPTRNLGRDDYASLVTFGGEEGTSFQWKLLNDPVMGGVSFSTFTPNTSNKTAVWKGEVKIVPSLQAPGFCNAETRSYFGKFNSAEGYDALQIRMKSDIPYDGWKVSFAANTLNPQFSSFKSDFNVTADGAWHLITVPFNGFSNKWSAATGEPTTRCSDDPSVCPKANDLARIQQFGFWTEGVAGQFSAEIDFVRAVNMANVVAEERVAAPRWESSCAGPVQSNLRYNMSNVPTDNFIIPLPEDESLADAICCDANFKGFAEPIETYARGDVNLFGILDPHQNRTKAITFYDPVCGIPLFVVGGPNAARPFKAFQEETEEHGWPSFRPSEVVEGMVYIEDGTGLVYSKCGTHLGSNEPDEQGTRYCLDLACVSGSPLEF